MLVRPRRIERLSEALQTPAMTTSAKVALVRREGIEPPSRLCKSRALPLDERRKLLGRLPGYDPSPWAPQTQVLPLHHKRHWYHRQESNLVLGLRRAV
jgi:hypothetical protein